jgi:hypothetical protein
MPVAKLTCLTASILHIVYGMLKTRNVEDGHIITSIKYEVSLFGMYNYLHCAQIFSKYECSNDINSNCGQEAVRLRMTKDDGDTVTVFSVTETKIHDISLQI